MKQLPPIAKFLYARIAEDENALQHDDRHWSEVPAQMFSHDRLDDEIRAKKELVRGLLVVADFAWSQSYGVRDHGRAMLEALADVYASHPDYRPDWWNDSETP